MFNLNRFELFKIIDENTPYDVIINLISTCGKNIDKKTLNRRRNDVVSFIKNYKNEINLEGGIKDEDYPKLAKYISSASTEWKKENIKKSFQHLLKFYNNLDKLHLRELSPLGEKVNNKVNSYDIIMLYSYGMKKNIIFDKEDNYFDIYRKLKDAETVVVREPSPVVVREPSPVVVREPSPVVVREPSPVVVREPSPVVVREPSPVVVREPSPVVVREPSPVVVREPSPPLKIDREEIISKIMSNLRNETDENLSEINKLINPPGDFDFKKSDKEELDQIKNKINLYYLISKSCLTDLEAIVYAAKFYSFDLSYSSNPSIELNKLNSSRINDKKYVPVLNDIFSELYSKNNNLFNMDKIWRKNIRSLYPQKTLNSLISHEGGDSEKEENFLSEQYKINNFYQGLIPSESIEKTFLENKNLEEISKNNIISFGNMDTNRFIYTSIDELSDFFEKENDFTDLIDNTNSINIHSIRKLINICKEFPHIDSYSKLINIIEEIKSDGKIKCPIIENLLEKYLFNSDSLDRFFVSLYEISIAITNGEDHYQETEKSFYKMKNYNDINIRNILKNISLIKYNKRFFKLNNFNNISTVYELMEKIEDKNTNNLKEYGEILKITSYYYYHILSGRNLYKLD